MGSDHFPIWIQIRGCYNTKKKVCHVIHWDTFRFILDSTNDDIIDAIKTALRNSTRTIRLPEHFPSPGLKLLNLSAARHRAQIRYRRHPILENKINFNRILQSSRGTPTGFSGANGEKFVKNRIHEPLSAKSAG
ncbi:unnamed protein product [Ixodes pacificus]